MKIPNYNDLDCPGKLGNLYIKKQFPEFYEYLINRYKNYNNKKFSELLYCYYNDINIHPVCPVCGKDVPFLNKSQGYQTFCSLKCSNSSQDVKNKKIQTNIERFGVPHASQNENLKQQIIETTTLRYGGMGNASPSTKEKQQKSMKEIYGHKYALCNEELKKKAINSFIERWGGIGVASPEIMKKVLNTNKNKYGCDWVMGLPEIRERAKITNLIKYGYPVATQSKDIKSKISNSKRISIINNSNNIISISGENKNIIYTCSCPHLNCNKCKEKCFDIPSDRYYGRIVDHTELCTKLLPIKYGCNKDTTLELFVRNILDEYNIEYEANVRKIIYPQELDIYIPSKNLAIECNGCYWHSRNKKPILYHVNKFKTCEKQNIQLISLWEDWIINNPEIVRSMILNKLGIFGDRIYARNCYVKEINSKICTEFLNDNHIQGKTFAKIKLGLYYKNDLVSVMTFGGKKGCMGNNKVVKNEWELSRFCNKLNIQVLGGASKLLKYFIKNYNPSSIYSFSSNDISNGNLYKTLGFQKCDKISQAYWYVDIHTLQRYHRTSFTKDNIIKLGLASPDKKWTEREVMMKYGLFQIYDSGTVKWAMNL